MSIRYTLRIATDISRIHHPTLDLMGTLKQVRKLTGLVVMCEREKGL